MSPLDLLNSLRRANWHVATRTYGSSHATLIGVIADWWVKLEPDQHTVLDGAPSFGDRNAGWCDLMLCDGHTPRGVVEVEGTKPLDKLATLEGYFGSKKPSLGEMTFGLLLLYAYFIKGRKPNRRYPRAESPEVYAEALRVSAKHPSKALFLVAVDKSVDRDPGHVRLASPYHIGSVCLVTASVLLDGQEHGRQCLWEAQSSLMPSSEA
ncbi:MAG: hypothetical protein HS128_20410 [Ideonella sp.]|nr:hypothetical protein [Ideonella sp.]